VAYSNRGTNSDPVKAIAHLERAVAAPTKYAAHFAELDGLYAEAGKPPEQRLALLEQNHAVVTKRDDALSHEIGLKIFAGKYDEAIQLMTRRKFSVWEGGSLDVADHWVNAHVLRGQQKVANKQFAVALADFQAAKTIPDNLPTDRGGGGHESEIAYWIGIAHEGLGEMEKAKQSWQEAAVGSAPIGGRGRGRGGAGGGRGFAPDRSVQRYYQALAQRKLGQTEQAQAALRELANTATPETGADSQPTLGPRRGGANRQATAHYAAGLGHLGLGEVEQARIAFAQALKAAPDHLGAQTKLRGLAPAK
jgi:tetratricopeptide (TPR) repeat protein